MNCQWTSLEEGSTCVRYGCNTTLRRDYTEPPVVECHGRYGPGDWLADELTKRGLSKEAYKEAKAELGLPPDCWCEWRQAWLNKFDAWVREKLAHAV